MAMSVLDQGPFAKGFRVMFSKPKLSKYIADAKRAERSVGSPSLKAEKALVLGAIPCSKLRCCDIPSSSLACASTFNSHTNPTEFFVVPMAAWPRQCIPLRVVARQKVLFPAMGLGRMPCLFDGILRIAMSQLPGLIFFNNCIELLEQAPLFPRFPFLAFFALQWCFADCVAW